MYHCCIRFYFIGLPCRLFEIIKGTAPLDHFSHKFSESDRPEKNKLAKADVILANLQDMDAEKALQAVIENKTGEAMLILLTHENQISLLTDFLPEVTDIWTMPMSDKEMQFRFHRWQHTYKMSKDYWQTSQYLEATINNIPNLIWYKDKNGIHKKVNDSFCHTVNKTKQQVEGRGHAYIWDVEYDDPACIESERNVMEKKETCISEEIILTGEGKRILTTYKSPLYDIDKSVMGTVGVAIDITQERAYEQELINKNETLETLFTTMDCGILCHSIDGSRILNVNRTALKILGYESQDELMDMGFHLIATSVLKEDRAKLQASIRELKEEGDSVNVEYRVQHSDGKLLYIIGNIKLVKEHGELFYQRLLFDCTAQKLQEKIERSERERRHTELIQALSIDYTLICFFNLDTGMGYPVRTNVGNEYTLDSIFDREISLEEGMENYINNYVYEGDKKLLHQASSPENLKKELAHKNMFYTNYRIYKDGQIKYFQMKTVRAGDWEKWHGIVIGFRSVDEEIRKEIEQQKQLEDALIQANKANKAKSVFLSNMSHDIRTPMNAIVGFTNLAINHIDQSDQVESYLKKIMTSGNHLLSLINDILDMSRIESGKITLEEKPCSLSDILHELRNILQADINSKQLELDIDTIDVLNEEIYCDKLRLNQVLLNLLSNAIKYTPAGGTVSVRLTEKSGAPEGMASYEFCIKDTGIGMSEEFVSHIFEPFERERNTTISKIQGTGLGMAITKNIIDMMKGVIVVKSKQNVGTEITVSFTFRLNTGAKKPQTIPEFKDCRALVVDDDFNTCDSVSYMLEQVGMRAEWTLSGKEAVLRTKQAFTRNDDYTVYIIDWLLPDMNGVEVTRRIRKEIGENASIIILTAYDWSDIAEEAKEAGVTAFCSKPLFLSELRECLSSIVHSEKNGDTATDQEKAPVHTGRILLAEDVDLNQEIATVILEEAGFSVDVAENGKITVDKLKASEPGYYQVILMDIQMPVMDGYEATKIIRQLEDKKLANIPILAMSANAFEEDKKAALACGMNGHIAKPIDMKKLFETLDEVLANNESNNIS